MATGGSDQSIKDGHDFFYDWRCSKCEEDDRMSEATSYCKNCNEGFCDSCLKSHNKFLRGHEVLGQGDKADWGEPAPIYDSGVACPEHPGQNISMYCGNHDEVCCPVCAVMHHGDVCRPKMSYVPDSAKGVASNSEFSKFKTQADQLLARIAQIEDEQSVCQSAVNTSQDKCRSDIEEIEEMVIKRLEDHRKTSLSEVNQLHNEEEKKIANKLETCAEMKKQLNDIGQKIQTTAAVNEASLFVTMKTGQKKLQVYREKCEELCKTQHKTYTFQTSQDLMQLDRSTSFGKCVAVEEKRKDARPMYEDQVLICGIKRTTTKDCLFKFLEAKSGGAIPKEQQQGEKDDVRLVTFQQPIEFDRLKKNAQRLEGADLQLEQVPVSNCIYVANYDESLGKDTLALYFENTLRSGGGQVEKVCFNENEGFWLVYFADCNAIKAVLQREHKLGLNKLIVKLYIDCLGRPQGGDGEFRFKAPEPVLVPEPNTQKIKFILSSVVSKQVIEVQMESCYARIKWPNKSDKPPLQVKLECTLTQKVTNSYKLAKDWKQTALKNFQDYLKTIAVMQNNVRTELLSDVVKALQEITIENPDAVVVFVENDQGLVTVVGMKKAAENLSSEIKQKIKKVEEAADLARQRTKEVVTNLRLIQTKMLLAIKYPTKMEEKYKDLKVKINQNKNELTFDGFGKDIKAAKLDMYEMKNSFASMVCRDVPKQSLCMHQLKQVKEYIVKSLKQRNAPAVWDVDNDELVICSVSEGTLVVSVQLIRGAVTENSVPLSKASRPIVNTYKWDSMTQEIQAMHPGRTMITVTDSAVVITTTNDVEQCVLAKVKGLLRFKSPFWNRS